MFYSSVNISIDIAVQTINEITDNSKFIVLKNRLFHDIVSAVHFIADYEERIRPLLADDDAELFKAFLYVNNQLKHDKSLELFYYPVAGSMFPLFFPMKFGDPSVSWANFPDNGNQNARGKRFHYEKNLMNRDIKASLIIIKKVIEKYII